MTSKLRRVYKRKGIPHVMISGVCFAPPVSDRPAWLRVVAMGERAHCGDVAVDPTDGHLKVKAFSPNADELMKPCEWHECPELTSSKKAPEPAVTWPVKLGGEQVTLKDVLDFIGSGRTMVELNEINEALRDAHKRTVHKATRAFRVGEQIAWTKGGTRYIGTITKVNQRTVSAITGEGHRWKIAGSLAESV